ncbi:hypothetical protein GCM10010124_21530 [Pilimelia terevasa]|uniref:Anti-sigma factor antagonist n=1 Tax=Pilimelia terevasa TaxID=53372 RepID=A0A8J3BKY6_9ACTN|nr:hypothetical protein GCM10010124_21530 [Pilimelia terevasa]
MTAEVRRHPDGTVEIAFGGEIDIETAHEISDAVTQILHTEQPPRIALNMRAVTFIDSVGISALVACFQAAGVSGTALVVAEPSPNVHRTLWVTGLHGLFGAPEPALTP